MFGLSKRNNKNKNNWCVILKPIDSELSKAKTVEKIVELFPLAIEEASQLVERTPIIFLEDISYQKAGTIRDLFADVKAYLLITNDVFEKRKCYRTVWPKDPFIKIGDVLLDGGQEVNDPKVQKKKLSKDSAIETIRKEQKQNVGVKELSAESTKTVSSMISAVSDDFSVSSSSEINVQKKSQEKAKTENNDNAPVVINSVKDASLFQTKFFGEDTKEETLPHGEFEYLSLELEKSKQDIQQKEYKIVKLEERLKKFKNMSETATEIDELQRERDDLIQCLKEEEKQKEAFAGECERLRDMLNGAESDNTELRTVQNAYSELQNKYEYLEDEIRDFAARRSEYEELRDKNRSMNSLVDQKDKEIQNIQETNEQLRAKIDALLAEQQKNDKEKTVAVEKLDQEISGLKTELGKKEEEISGLKDANKKTEEKITAMLQENTALREINSLYMELQSKCEILESELEQYNGTEDELKIVAAKKDEIEKLLEEKENLVCALRGKIEVFEKELDVLRAENESFRSDKVNAEREIEDLKCESTGNIKLIQEKAETLEQEKKRLKDLLHDMQIDNERLQGEIKNINEQYGLLEEQYASMEKEVLEFSAAEKELQQLNGKYSSLLGDLDNKDKMCSEYKVSFSNAEAKIEELTDELENLNRDMDVLRTENKVMRNQINDYEADRDKFVELGRTYNEMREKFVETKNELEIYKREKDAVIDQRDTALIEGQKRIEKLERECAQLRSEVEIQQRTIRDLASRRDSEEDVQKRIRLQETILNTESALKELVKSQEYIEKEIVDRESKMKEILGKQEEMERSLISLKQEKKHLAEKAKLKEKQRFTKSNSLSNGSGNSQEPSEQMSLL